MKPLKGSLLAASLLGLAAAVPTSASAALVLTVDDGVNAKQVVIDETTIGGTSDSGLIANVNDDSLGQGAEPPLPLALLDEVALVQSRLSPTARDMMAFASLMGERIDYPVLVRAMAADEDRRTPRPSFVGGLPWLRVRTSCRRGAG